MNSFLPMNEAVLAGGLSLFTKVSGIVSGMVTVIFVMRLTYSIVTIAPASEYGSIIKDTSLFLALLSIYPIILKLTVFGIGDVATKISYLPPEKAQYAIQEFMNRMFADYPLFGIFGKIGGIVIIAMAQSIYTALISLFIASAPIFIFLGTLLGIHGGLRSYFTMLIALSLWPVMWNLLGQLALTVGSQFEHSPVSSVCFWVVVQILQFLSPFFSYGLFKNMQASLGLSQVAMIGGMIA